MHERMNSVQFQTSFLAFMTTGGLINVFTTLYTFSFNFLRKLFWTDTGAQPVVESASLEGRERAVIARTNLVSPTGLTLDFTEDRVFWCDQGKGTIETAALDGSDRRVLSENQVGEVCVKCTRKNNHFLVVMLNILCCLSIGER